MRNLTLRTLLTGLLLAASAAGLAHELRAGQMQGHWMAPPQAAARPNPVPATAASAARGEALFQTHCAACHGTGGEGDGPAAAGLEPRPANLREMSAHHSDGDLAWKIAHGRGPMPGWKKTLKPAQIWDLVNYIRRLAG